MLLMVVRKYKIYKGFIFILLLVTSSVCIPSNTKLDIIQLGSKNKIDEKSIDTPDFYTRMPDHRK